jgi:hypothetical protein
MATFVLKVVIIAAVLVAFVIGFSPASGEFTLSSTPVSSGS